MLLEPEGEYEKDNPPTMGEWSHHKSVFPFEILGTQSHAPCVFYKPPGLGLNCLNQIPLSRSNSKTYSKIPEDQVAVHHFFILLISLVLASHFF